MFSRSAIVQYAFSRVAIALLLLSTGGCGTEDRAASGSGRPQQQSPSADISDYEAIDDAGRIIRLTAPARRIISLLPAATETLIDLGLTDRLVGRTDFDDSELAHLPSVGGGLTPSIEIIASLEPDLVIAWEEAAGARVRPRLEALGIPVMAVATRDTAGIFSNIERLGRLTGEPARADSLAAGMRSELEEIRRSIEGREPPPVVYLIGLDPPMVAGPNVFIGEILEVAGGGNVFDDLTAPSPQISVEEIVRRRPEIVLVPESGSATMPVDALARQPGWRELIAAGKTRVHTLPPDILHRPGPSVVSAARQLRDILHPNPADFR